MLDLQLYQTPGIVSLRWNWLGGMHTLENFAMMGYVTRPMIVLTTLAVASAEWRWNAEVAYAS